MSIVLVPFNMDIFIFFSFLFTLAYVTAEDCPATKCGKNEVDIRFPFQLEGKNCGYPGFDLECKNQDMIVLKLPYSGEFYVRSINYINQQVNLYDPDGCIPKRLLSFNLSGSPFITAFHRNYTFLNCPTQVTKSRFTTVDCLSNSTNSVLATPSTSLANSLSTSSCRIITTLPVPVSGSTQSNEAFSVELDQDIQLTWFEPECGDCELQKGICGFKNNNSRTKEIACFHFSRSGKSVNGLQVLRIVCISIAIPAFSCALGMAFVACCLTRRRSNPRQNPDVSPVTPTPSVVAMGLDESTIESYEKVVLGESRRLPGRNTNTCSICLVDYLSKDTVRCIPECQHCFHAECIDEWLRMNSSWPLCRKSPSAADAADAIAAADAVNAV